MNSPDHTYGIIYSPVSVELDALCDLFSACSGELESERDWPAKQLQACAEAGVFTWFVPISLGGQEWNDADILRGYLRLSQSCLTTTFILTQWAGACRRIVASPNTRLRDAILPRLLRGKSFATLGISHLTTSRQHFTQPVLRASVAGDGFVLNGFSPWVTGAAQADDIVTGATLDDGKQILVVSDRRHPTVEVAPPASLVGLSASQTGAVHFHGTPIAAGSVLAGPTENVIQQSSGTRTGGLQTSTLALGLTGAALEFMHKQSHQREELVGTWKELESQWQSACTLLLDLAEGSCEGDRAAELRAKSNSLALRATQSALVAAKGAGFTSGHPAGRWCREALFFLVWSCPQPVLSANLCEFANIS